MLALAQHPELENEASPFQPVAGGGAGRAEHLVAAIILVQDPVLIEMLWHAEIQCTGGTTNDEVGDTLGLGQIVPVARRFKRCHQRFGQMHVGVLAAIILDGRPIAIEFFFDCAVLFFPEPGLKNVGNVGQHLVCQRMANCFGR